MAAQGVIVGEERYVFETQWYDQQAELNRYYRITFYPGDSTIEMVSQKQRIHCRPESPPTLDKFFALGKIPNRLI